MEQSDSISVENFDEFRTVRDYSYGTILDYAAVSLGCMG